MKRNTYKLKRGFRDTNTSLDIIYKKSKLMEILRSDSDIIEVLSNNIDDDESEYIVDYLKLNGTQTQKNNYICYDIYTERSSYDNRAFRRDYLIIMILVKENDIKNDVFFIPDCIEVRRTDEAHKNDVNKDDIDIEDETLKDLEYRKQLEAQNRENILEKEPYIIPKTDLLSYIIKDLLSWSNVLGDQLVCYSDEPKIVDNGWYCRELRFATSSPNAVPTHPGMHNKYDFI